MTACLSLYRAWLGVAVRVVRKDLRAVNVEEGGVTPLCQIQAATRQARVSSNVGLPARSPRRICRVSAWTMGTGAVSAKANLKLNLELADFDAHRIDSADPVSSSLL